MKPNWCQQQREAWIAETLRIFGFIQRKHLQRKFGITRLQASIDLKRFHRAQPTAMVYNPSAKRYEAAAS